MQVCCQARCSAPCSSQDLGVYLLAHEQVFHVQHCVLRLLMVDLIVQILVAGLLIWPERQARPSMVERGTSSVSERLHAMAGRGKTEGDCSTASVWVRARVCSKNGQNGGYRGCEHEHWMVGIGGKHRLSVAAMAWVLASVFLVRAVARISLRVCGVRASTNVAVAAAATSVRPVLVWALRVTVLTLHTAVLTPCTVPRSFQSPRSLRSLTS